MPNISGSLSNLHLFDELANQSTWIHRLHPLVKLSTTLIYLIVVISFDRYEVGGLLPLFLYPVLVFSLAELPLAPIVNRILLVEPLILGIGILNPLLDERTIVFGGLTISMGWLTFLSLVIKGGLTVAATILLVATTNMDEIARALRLLKVPRIFVLQLLLTYRYISVLVEEVSRMLRAYTLRAPGQKGVHWRAWGSFAGLLLLRTFERAQRVYMAMSLRGFTGEYHTGSNVKIRPADLIYVLSWSTFFVLVRFFNLPAVLGQLFTGVIG